MAILERGWELPKVMIWGKLDGIGKNFWNKHMEDWQVINMKAYVDIYWLERRPHVDEVSLQTDVYYMGPIAHLHGLWLHSVNWVKVPKY